MNRMDYYELKGDYYIPYLTLPEEEQVEIDVWEQHHFSLPPILSKRVEKKTVVCYNVQTNVPNLARKGCNI